MPFLLVLIRKSRWYGAVPQFRGAPDIPADCLADLKTDDNELSSWFVDEEKANLNRIVTALAANRDDLSHVDYMTFDFNLPNTLNISLRKSNGETPDSYANRSWHHDLTGLSARQVVELAVEIYSSGTKTRLQEKVVRALIQEAISRREVDRMKIKPKLAQKVLSYGRKSLWGRIQRLLRLR